MAAAMSLQLQDAAGAMLGQTLGDAGRASISAMSINCRRCFTVKGASALRTSCDVESLNSRRESQTRLFSGEGETEVAVEAAKAPLGTEVEAGVVPSGEWAHNFSIQTYEDLSVHLHSSLEEGSEERPDSGSAPAAAAESPILPDSSHGVVSGEWGHNFSIQTYEDLHQHFSAAAEREASRVATSPLLPDKSHGVVSGEWGHSLSIQTYEDLQAHFAADVFKKGAEPDTLLADIMVREVRAARPSDTLAAVAHHLAEVTGLPVVDESLRCVGLLSKRDVAEGVDQSSTLVGAVMTTPPVTLTPDKTVKDAVIEMLRRKIHRVPVVNAEGQLVGIVTRTDIFTALEAGPQA